MLGLKASITKEDLTRKKKKIFLWISKERKKFFKHKKLDQTVEGAKLNSGQLSGYLYCFHSQSILRKNEKCIGTGMFYKSNVEQVTSNNFFSPCIYLDIKDRKIDANQLSTLQ